MLKVAARYVMCGLLCTFDANVVVSRWALERQGQRFDSYYRLTSASKYKGCF